MALLISSYRTTREWGLCILIFFSQFHPDAGNLLNDRQDELGEIQDVGSLIVQTDELLLR